ncbi:MAG: protein kinase [Planctomycetota bacterium]
MIGTLGRFQLLEEIGRGGMGCVYRARDEHGREVALKVLLEADEAELERFAREARAAAALRHPNVLPVHGLERAGGRPALVMDLVTGGSLEARLKEGGPLECGAAARVVAEVARAVAAAHAQGVLHRDLKPQNVLFSGERPLLCDFGLARTGPSTLTRTGEVLGTPGYMSPEQALGDRAAIGPATDVYGLGALLYAALTGQPPFRGSSALATLDLVVNGRLAPPRELRPAVPAALEALCLRALAREPAARWPSAGAFADALEDWEATRAAPGPRRVPPLLAAALGAGAALALLLGAGLVWRASREPARSGPAVAASAPAASQGSPAASQGSPAASQGSPAVSSSPAAAPSSPGPAGAPSAPDLARAQEEVREAEEALRRYELGPARAAVARALERGPEHAPALALDGWLQALACRWEPMTAAFQRAAAREGGASPRTRYYWGLSLVFQSARVEQRRGELLLAQGKALLQAAAEAGAGQPWEAEAWGWCADAARLGGSPSEEVRGLLRRGAGTAIALLVEADLIDARQDPRGWRQRQAAYRRALELRPLPDAYRALAAAEVMLAQVDPDPGGAPRMLEAARDDCARGLALNPDDPLLAHQLGWHERVLGACCERQRELEAAQVAFRRAAGLLERAARALPDSASVWHELGLARWGCGRDAEALDALARAWELEGRPFGSPSAERLVFCAAHLARREWDRPDRALALLQRAGPLLQRDPLALIRLGAVRGQRCEWEAAERAFRTAREAPRDLRGPEVAALALQMRGAARLRRWQFEHDSALLDAAGQDLVGADRELSSCGLGVEAGMARLCLAWVLLEQQRYSDLEALIQRAEDGPADQLARTLRAHARLQQGDLAAGRDAVAGYEALVQGQGPDSLLVCYLLQCCALTGNPARAAEVAGRAAKMLPWDPLLLTWRGMTRIKDAPRAALEDFAAGLRLVPRNYMALFGRARAQEQLGDFPAALATWHELARYPGAGRAIEPQVARLRAAARAAGKPLPE